MLKTKLIALAIAGTTTGAWLQRDYLVKTWQDFSRPQSSQMVVYRWTDKEGTVHYNSRPENTHSVAVTIDTSHVNTLAPLPPIPLPETKKQLALARFHEELALQRQQMQEARIKQILQE